MLKIKDSVDLKELEKFGFKDMIDEGVNYYTKQFEFEGEFRAYWVERDTKIIEIETNTQMTVVLDETIYDLIKADLVEKVNT